jgi:hypothetical protein
MNRPIWRWVVFSAALALGTDAAAQKSHNETLVERAGWARLVAAEGKIVALPLGVRESRSTTCNNPQTASSEALSVVAEAGRANLRYQFSDDSQQLTIDITRGDTVSIHREPRGDRAVVSLHFTQTREGLSLEVGELDERRHVTADNLWQLLLVHGDVAGPHLAPILESLEGDWMLRDTVRRAESALLRLVDNDLSVRRRRCLELVERLSSQKFEERRAAYQQLQKLGPAAVGLLGDLRQYDLDAEQRLRLRALRGSLDTARDDTAEAIAAMLVDDARVWLALLGDDEPAVRSTAQEQLSRVTQTAVDFDPAADEATRQSQLETLRQRIERRFK